MNKPIATPATNPDTTSTGATAARAAIQQLGQHYGVDLGSIADDHSLTPEQRRQKLRQALYPAIHQHLSTAAPGEDPQAHEAVKNQIAAAAAAASSSSSSSSSSVSLMPNVWFEQSFITGTVAKKTGADVSEWVSAVMNDLKLTQSMTSPAQIATQITLSGIFGLGPVVYFAATAEGTLTLTARIAAGVARLGVAGWAALAAVIVLDIATWLMGQQAVFFGAIANDTTQDFKISDWRDGLDGDDDGDLYLKHGKMVGFMIADVHHINDDQEVQLAAVRTVEGTDQSQTMVAVGLFTGEKRSGALVGVEGAMVFQPIENSSDPYVVLAFSCPYSGNNGACVNVTHTKQSPKDWWGKLEPKLALSSSDSQGSFSAAVQVSNQRGGEVSAIMVVTETG